MPGSIARSVAMWLWDQKAQPSILASGTFFREDLIMKIFLRPFKKSSCKLMAKEYASNTGYLLQGGLSRNSVYRITDRSDMTLAFDHGCKALTQPVSQFYLG